MSATEIAAKLAKKTRELVESKGASALSMSDAINVTRDIVKLAQETLPEASDAERKEAVLTALDVGLEGTIIHNAVMLSAGAIIDAINAVPPHMMKNVVDVVDKIVDGDVDEIAEEACDVVTDVAEMVGDAVGVDVSEVAEKVEDVLDDVLPPTIMAKARNILGGCCTIA